MYAIKLCRRRQNTVSSARSNHTGDATNVTKRCRFQYLIAYSAILSGNVTGANDGSYIRTLSVHTADYSRHGHAILARDNSQQLPKAAHTAVISKEGDHISAQAPKVLALHLSICNDFYSFFHIIHRQ